MKNKNLHIKSVYIEPMPYCPFRSLDIDRLTRYFRTNGYNVIDDVRTADFIIYSTCGAVTEQENTCFKRMEELQKCKGELIVVGCLREINPEKHKIFFSGKAFLSTELPLIDKVFPEFRCKFNEIADSGECLSIFDENGFLTDVKNAEKNKKSGWWVRTSLGCEKKEHCSYCVVWKGYGTFRSKPLSVCIKEIEAGVMAGHNTFKIVDPGAYGIDIGLTYPDLIKEILQIKGVKKLVLFALNPHWIIQYLDPFVEIVKTRKIVSICCAHQSGSDRILKLMKRNYCAKDCIESLMALKKVYPELKLGTHFMVGFPSETKIDFACTIDMIEKVGFDDYFAAAFSARPGTDAFNMLHKVPPQEIKNRVTILKDCMNIKLGKKPMNKYSYVWFDEKNFVEQKVFIKSFLNVIKAKNGSALFLKRFPPCIFSNLDIKLVDKELIFSNKDFVIDNNLFFGEEFVKINKKFIKSPYISRKCKNCKYFKNSYCKGLVNKVFLDIKQNIIKKRTKEQYDALKIEYLNGAMVYSSECNYNCLSCATERKRYDFLVEIIPQLEIYEIMHFLHYIPASGVSSNLGIQKCVVGEPLLHKDINRILNIAAIFSVDSFTITTNGSTLNNSLLKSIADKGFSLFLSLHTINNKVRKKIMGYDQEINLENLLKKITKYIINLKLPTVVLKENIVSGDLKKTIIFLKRHGLKPLIYRNYYSIDANKEIVGELGYDSNFLVDYLKKNDLLNYVDLTFNSMDKIFEEFIITFKQFILDLNSKKKILILSSPFSYLRLKNSLINLKNVTIVEVRSKLAGNIIISSSLLVEDFMETLSKIKEVYDYYIVPRKAFNVMLMDLKGRSINELLAKIDGKVYLI